MTTPRDDIAGLSERLRDYRVWSATHGRYNAVELTLEAATALDALQARVKELEDHNRRLGQGGAERYWEERYRDEAAHALRARQERDTTGVTAGETATPSDPTAERREIVARGPLFHRKLREDGSVFVTCPRLPMFSFVLEPGQSDDLMNATFVKYIELNGFASLDGGAGE